MVEGKYLAKGKIMGSLMDNLIEYHVSGNTLTGTMTVIGTVAEVLDGTVDGDEFKHRCEVVTPFGAMKVEIEGEVDEDEITIYMFNKLTKTKFEGTRIED